MAQGQRQNRSQSRQGAQPRQGPQAQRGQRGAARGSVQVVDAPQTAEQQRALGRRARQRAVAAQQARRRRLLTWLGAGSIVVVAAIVVAAVLLTRSPSALTDPNALNPGNPIAVGKTAPNFTLSTIDGKSYSLAAQRGHPVLLEFFAVWCPHCQNEAPILNRIEKTYDPKGLRPLAILANPFGRNYDLSGQTDTRLADAGDIQWFKSTFNVTHPMLIDPNFATVNRYGANSYPTIYVINRKGVIVYVHQGDQTYQQLSAAIQKASK